MNAILQPTSRLTFGPVSAVAEGAGLLVGDLNTGTFLALPEVGAVTFRELAAGRTLFEAAAAAQACAGQEVDVLDFATTLIEAGLVAAVDDTPLSQATAAAPWEWLAGVPAELVRPLFSRPAWVVYGGLFLFCLALFALQPRYWPSVEDFFFYPDPAVCAVVMLVTNTCLGACHEVSHWLAGRAVGVAARFSVDRRLFFPVFETDLSQLWSVSRSRRYSPFLAGMAFDTTVLAACLGVRALWGADLIDVPPLVVRFLGAVVLSCVFALGWQTLVFLRTDLYAVLVTALGCFNLYRVTTLELLRKLRRLGAAEAAELAQAHPRDRQVAAWFAWLYLAGLGWTALVFVVFFIPGTAMMAGWLFGSLRGAPPNSAPFWEALTLGTVAGFQALLPLAILGWQRLGQRRRTAA